MTTEYGSCLLVRLGRAVTCVGYESSDARIDGDKIVPLSTPEFRLHFQASKPQARQRLPTCERFKSIRIANARAEVFNVYAAKNAPNVRRNGQLKLLTFISYEVSENSRLLRDFRVLKFTLMNRATKTGRLRKFIPIKRSVTASSN